MKITVNRVRSFFPTGGHSVTVMEPKLICTSEYEKGITKPDTRKKKQSDPQQKFCFRMINGKLKGDVKCKSVIFEGPCMHFVPIFELTETLKDQ